MKRVGLIFQVKASRKADGVDESMTPPCKKGHYSCRTLGNIKLFFLVRWLLIFDNLINTIGPGEIKPNLRTTRTLGGKKYCVNQTSSSWGLGGRNSKITSLCSGSLANKQFKK